MNHLLIFTTAFLAAALALLSGLVGNQGAIRSAFLLNYDLSKEAFLATGIVIGKHGHTLFRKGMWQLPRPAPT